MGPIKTKTLQGPSEKINLWDFDTINGREKLLLYTKFVLFVDGKLDCFTFSYLQQLSRWNYLKCFVKLDDSLLVLFIPHVCNFNSLLGIQPKKCWEPTFFSHTSRSSTPRRLNVRMINFYYSDFVLYSSLVWHVAGTCRRGVDLWPNCHLNIAFLSI